MKQALIAVLVLLAACRAAPEPAMAPHPLESSDFEVIPLEYASAGDVAQLIGWARQGASSATCSSCGKAVGLGGAGTVVADARLNAVIVVGSEASRASVRELVKALDVEVVTAPRASAAPAPGSPGAR